MIRSSLFPMGAVLLSNADINYQADAYPKYVGSVLARNALLRCSTGAAFPLFATHMFRQSEVDWACSMLGFLSIAFIPVPILLYKYGRMIKMASSYARHDL
jgi:DHA1 family multidrug resistance protein-like MFS transporter